MNAARFWQRIDRTGVCWPWSGCKTRDGHGQIKWHGKTRPAHHIAYELVTGTVLPAGAILMHDCDNPACCNPAHLKLGTHALNRADCVNKGRHARGERNGRAKLDWSKVAAIRAAWRKGLATKAELASLYRVSERAITFVVTGQSWQTQEQPA